MEGFKFFENPFGSKHSEWMKKARVEAGSVAAGAGAYFIAKYFLPTLGLTNPFYLTLAAAASALGGYAVFKKDHKK